jgi:predicted Zn finger-like uncharacterized protein
MPISVHCPSCSAAFKVKDEYAGKRAKCPKCSEPLTIPAAAAPPEPAAPPVPAPVVARPVVAARVPPKPADSEDTPTPKHRRDEDEVRPAAKRRRGGDEEEKDDQPMRGRGEDEDAPKRRRRRSDDDDEPKKKSNALPIVLGIVGGVLLLCGGGCAGVYFFVLKPAGESFASTLNSIASAAKQEREFEDKFQQVKGGMTKEQVEDLLGPNHTKAQEHDVGRVASGLPDWPQAGERWKPKVKLGHVLMWEKSGDGVLVAFSADPNAAGTVVGAVGNVGVRTTEPVKLPGGTPPDEKAAVATLTVDALRQRHAEFLNKRVTVTGQYVGAVAGDRGAIELRAGPGETLVVAPQFGGTGFGWKRPPRPLDKVELTGRVGGTARMPTVFDAEVEKVTPNAAELTAVSAEDLASEFDKDAVAATKKYNGRMLKVTGTASSTASGGDQLGFRGITNKAPGAKFKSVFIDFRFDGEFRADAGKVKINDTVSVVGLFTGFSTAGPTQSGHVVLVYCRVER